MLNEDLNSSYFLDVMNMSKIKKGIAVFIIFLTFIIVLYEFIQLPMYQEAKAYGFFIEFENGITEPEVKTILENYNMILNYSIDCSNASNGGQKYYIKVYKNNLSDLVGDGLRKDGNWTYDGTYDTASYYFIKGNYCIIPVTEEAITDKKFLAILKKNNLQVKTFIWCDISYGKNFILEKDAVRIKNELKTNEKVWTVIPKIPTY